MAATVAAVATAAREAMVVSLGSVVLASLALALPFKISAPFVAATAGSMAALATGVLVETVEPGALVRLLTLMAGLVARVATEALQSLPLGALAGSVVMVVLVILPLNPASQAVAAAAVVVAVLAGYPLMAQMAQVALAATVVLAAMGLRARTAQR